MGDPHPQETAHYVAVQARTEFIEANKSLDFSNEDMHIAEMKMREFLIGNIVVRTPQYKLTYRKLEDNLNTAKRHNQQVRQQIEKLRIVLETAISVALSNVSYPCQEQAPADDASDGDDAGGYDDDAQRARLDRLDVELYGPYLSLVRELPNRHDIPRW